MSATVAVMVKGKQTYVGSICILVQDTDHTISKPLTVSKAVFPNRFKAGQPVSRPVNALPAIPMTPLQHLPWFSTVQNQEDN